MSRRRGRSLVVGAILAAVLSSVLLVAVTRVWEQPMHVPFQYTHVPWDDQQDATLDMMLIKNIHETGWFNTNPSLNAPFEQHWAEWPMGGDLLAYTIKKAIVDTTGDVPLTFNLFWLLTFPLTALIAFPVLRSLALFVGNVTRGRGALLTRAISLPERRRAREPRVLRGHPGDRALVHANTRAGRRAARRWPSCAIPSSGGDCVGICSAPC